MLPIMSTIRGENIRLIRPQVNHSIVRRDDGPRQVYDTRPRTIKHHCGRVAFTCIKLKNGGIRSVRVGGYDEIIETFDIDRDFISDFGVQLENGQYVWGLRYESNS